MKLPEEYIDSNGFPKPQLSWSASGNGLVYSAVAVLLGFEYDIKSAMSRCKVKNGLYNRTPNGSFGQQSWDDYMSIAVACIAISETNIPKQILWHGITHFGFYNNDGKLEMKDWLWRFPQVWALMWPAAFPKLKWLFYPVMWIISLTQKYKSDDSSGAQLTWIYLRGCKLAGLILKKHESVLKDLPKQFEKYYSNQHPFIEAVKELAKNEIQ